VQLHESIEVTQVYGVDAVNTKLAEGWRLLAVLATTYPGFNGTGVTYVLGKPVPKPDMAK